MPSFIFVKNGEKNRRLSREGLCVLLKTAFKGVESGFQQCR